MLELVGHRPHGELGNQPDQIRGDADMVRPLPDGFLPAGEGGAQQGSRLDLALFDDRAHPPRRIAGAAGDEVVAEPQEKRQQPAGVDIDRQIEHRGSLPSEAFE